MIWGLEAVALRVLTGPVFLGSLRSLYLFADLPILA